MLASIVVSLGMGTGGHSSHRCQRARGHSSCEAQSCARKQRGGGAWPWRGCKLGGAKPRDGHAHRMQPRAFRQARGRLRGTRLLTQRSVANTLHRTRLASIDSSAIALALLRFSATIAIQFSWQIRRSSARARPRSGRAIMFAVHRNDRFDSIAFR